MSEVLKLVILTIMNWIHLFATVAWIGGITYIFLVLLPATKMALEPPVIGKLMGVITKRMKCVNYISIVVLIVTGVVIQVLHPSYVGFKLGDRWTLVLTIKHLIMLFMIIIGVYVSEGVGPKIAKLAAKGPSPEVGRLQKKQMSLGFTNFILGIIVLLLTGYLAAINLTS